MNIQQLLDLMGAIVSFEYHTISKDVKHSCQVKGLVIGVSIELNENHSISVRSFDDSEESYEVSKIKNFKAVHLDPYAFFENIKNGSISVDI